MKKMGKTLGVAVFVAGTVSGCGAKNVSIAKERAGYKESSRLAAECSEPHATIYESKHGTLSYAKSSFDSVKQQGNVWWGSGSNVYAVVGFTPIRGDACRVKYYHYGGRYRDRLMDMQKLLEEKYPSVK